MSFVLVILAGVFVGAGAGRWLLSARQHYGSTPRITDGEYELSRRALMSHIHAKGTINLAQVERILDINGSIAIKCLDMMVQDGHLKAQSHGEQGVFYTLT